MRVFAVSIFLLTVSSFEAQTDDSFYEFMIFCG